MAARNLTARFCDSAKPTLGKQTAYPDADARGLELRVSAEGRKVWCFRYRTEAGQQKRLTLGVYAPDGQGEEGATGEAAPLDLRQARIAARRARAVVDAGGDPAGEKKRRRVEAKAQPLKTFNDLVEVYLAACESGRWQPRNKRKRARTLDDERGVYRRHIKAVLGDQRLETIHRRDVRDLLDGMAERGIGAQTARAHALIRQAFNYAIDRDRVEVNPALNIASVAKAGTRNRILTDADLKTFWNALADPSSVKHADGKPLYLSRPMAIALALSTLLLQRRAEVAGMMRAELDLEQSLWLIPGDRMKNGHPHLVPLPPRAVELIREALVLADLRGPAGNDGPVFPGAHDPEKPMRPDSLTHAMAAVVLASGVTKTTPHDLRRTGSTALTSERLRVSPFIRSLVLSHTTDSGGGAVVSRQHYDANEYVSEKRAALRAWEGLLLEMVGEQERSANVTPMWEAVA
jgi:integrase